MANNRLLNMGTTALRVVIALLGVLFIIMTITGSSTDADGQTVVSDSGMTGISSGLMLTYFTIGLCVLAWLLFGLKGLFSDLANSKKVLMGFAGFIVLLLVGYMLADSTVLGSWAEKGVTEGTSKWVGAGLMSFYVFISVAVLAIIWSEVSRMFK